MIGVKTVAAAVFVAFAVTLAGVAGALDGEYLAGLGRSAGLVIGVFAALAAALLSRLWRPGDRSRQYVGITRAARAAGEAALWRRGGVALVVDGVEDGSGAQPVELELEPLGARLAHPHRLARQHPGAQQIVLDRIRAVEGLVAEQV